MRDLFLLLYRNFAIWFAFVGTHQAMLLLNLPFHVGLHHAQDWQPFCIHWLQLISVAQLLLDVTATAVLNKMVFTYYYYYYSIDLLRIQEKEFCVICHFYTLWFPFFPYLLVTILYCLDICLVRRLFVCFFHFLPIFDQGFYFFSFVFFWSLTGNFLFSFCFLSIFDWELLFLFFVFFWGRGWKFASWVKVYGELGF